MGRYTILGKASSSAFTIHRFAAYNGYRYGKFFAEDMSEDCDKVSWSTWIYVCVSHTNRQSIILGRPLTWSLENLERWLSHGIPHSRKSQQNEQAG